MGDNTPKRNRIAQESAEQKLIDGLRKHAATVGSYPILGRYRSVNEIVATLQARIDASSAVGSAKAAWFAASESARVEREKLEPMVSNVKRLLLAFFGNQIDALADFGLTLPKARVVTPDQKAAAVAKAKATRAARHTMGPKQKKRVKGVVDPPAS